MSLGWASDTAICVPASRRPTQTSSFRESIAKRPDKVMGDYSCPVYFLHWQVGLPVSATVFGYGYHGFTGKGLVVFFLSLILILPLSDILIALLDAKVQLLRARIKARRTLLAPAASGSWQIGHRATIAARAGTPALLSPAAAGAIRRRLAARRLCPLAASALGPRDRPRVEIRYAFSFSQQRELTVLHRNQHSAGVRVPVGRCNRPQQK